MNIDIDVPDGKSGEWEVNTVTVKRGEISQILSVVKYGRGVVDGGTFKRLQRNGQTIMSNTPDEIRDFMGFVHSASGSILVNGLGLGVLLKALLAKPDVKEIIVIEKSEDVIKLCGPTYLKDERIKIIHADAFEYEPPKGKKFNAVWHDIWDTICADNLEEMEKLHRKYGRRTLFQQSWCRDRCEYQARIGW